MGEDYIRREEFNCTIARIHDRVDIISKSTTAIEVAAKYMSDSTKQIHDIVFGNGKPGAITRIQQLWTKVSIQWWLIGLIIGFLGGMAAALWQHVIK